MIHFLLSLALFLGFACQQKELEQTPITKRDSVRNSADEQVEKPAISEGIDRSEGELRFLEWQELIETSTSPRCLDCHTSPDQLRGPGIQGPQEILEYSYMRSRLAEGEFANDNPIYNKLIGKENHTGGEICAERDNKFCQKAKEWWIEEFGDGNGDISYGSILEVTTTGLIKGVAVDLDRPEIVLSVVIYRKQSDGSLQLIGEALADQSQAVSNQLRDHVFLLQIPANLIDNETHELQAFVLERGTEVKLSSNSFPYTAYKPKGEANVTGFSNIQLPANACNGCHNGFPYNDLWNSLAYPSPAEGGSATSNHLYLMSQPGSARASGHSGGAVGDAQAISLWWCEEFDPNSTLVSCQT